MQLLSTAPTETPPETEDGLSLQDFLQILRRRRMVVLQAFVLITLVVVIWTLSMRPVYQSVATLLVEAPTTQLDTVDSENPFSEILALTQPQSVDTQVQLLQSPSLMKAMQQQYGKDTSLTVDAIGDTNVIEVTGESTNPQIAADAPNSLLQLYISRDLDQNETEIQNTINFAQTEQAKAQKELNSSEIALEQFQLDHHVSDLQTDRSQQLDEAATLSSNLLAAKVTMASLQSQIAKTLKEMAAEPARKSAVSQTTNPELSTIRDQIAALRQQRVSMTQDDGYTDSAPPVLAVDAQIVQLKERLAAQPALVNSETIAPNDQKSALQVQLEALQAQAAAQQGTISQTAHDLNVAEASVRNFPAWEVTLTNLTRQRDQAATLEQMLTSKLADLTLRLNAHHATARIDQIAQIPDSPVRPKKALNFILGALFGLFVGVCLALLQEYLDDRINSAEDADRILGLPSLGRVPALSPTDARLLPLMKGLDPAAESYRVLRTNIQFASLDLPIHTLVVTSTASGEGKTTTATNLAFAMAMDGKRVILVDTDLRRPSINKLLELPSVPGLTDVLLGSATLEDTLLANEHLPNLSVLTAGSTPPSPADLLNSNAFHHLVDELKALCDVVVFDSPPVLVAADSAILAAQMDGTILVVETGHTRKSPAQHAVSLLRNGRAKLLGIAYNKMLISSNDYYYYRYHGPAQLEAPAEGSAKRPVEANKE